MEEAHLHSLFSHDMQLPWQCLLFEDDQGISMSIIHCRVIREWSYSISQYIWKKKKEYNHSELFLNEIFKIKF